MLIGKLRTLMNKRIIMILFLIIVIIVSFLEVREIINSKDQPPLVNIISLSICNSILIIGIYKLFTLILVYIRSKKDNPLSQIQNVLINNPHYEKLKIIDERVSENGQLEAYIVDADGLKLYVKSLIDVQLMDNIAIRKVYNFLLSSSTIIVDIGANVGYASLWFAKNNNVEKVFAYEPVLPTYEQALKSIQLNPDLKAKIEFRNIGLSDKTFKTSIVYNEEHHTISSVLFSKINGNENSKKQTEVVDIELVNACPIINEIIDYKEEQNTKLVLKIDCEGSEYQIINSFNSRIWNSVDVILMEVHGNDYHKLLEILQENGFLIFSINHQDHQLFDHLCDVYAIKECSLK